MVGVRVLELVEHVVSEFAFIVEIRLFADVFFFFFQAEDGIRDHCVTGVQTCALPICCANCRRMLEMRQETSARLRLLRESAPAFPASLDSSVLANYRKQIATRQRPEAASPWWRVEFAAWRLGVAVAAMLLILATVFGFHKPPVKTTIGHPTTGPAEIARQPE